MVLQCSPAVGDLGAPSRDSAGAGGPRAWGSFHNGVLAGEDKAHPLGTLPFQQVYSLDLEHSSHATSLCGRLLILRKPLFHLWDFQFHLMLIFRWPGCPRLDRTGGVSISA